MIHLFIFTATLLSTITLSEQDFQGAWKSDDGIMIFSSNFFAYTAFTKESFQYTYGGLWEINGESLDLTYEFHTQSPDKVGQTESLESMVVANSLEINGVKFTRLDDGNPGQLSGTWLFTNRVRDGEMETPRSQDNPRKTMKILSGTRFQWIAYNVDSKEFMGTGGGTYTTVNGKYTENIDFFSRDNSRVGASLVFDFEIKGDDWHHKGLSSRGDPIYEIWSRRK